MRYQWCLLTLILVFLASCGGAHTYAEHEDFQSDSRYYREFRANTAALCDAAQRVLLADGYVVAKQEDQALIGAKEFQVKEKSHAVLQVHISCAPRISGSTLFVTATEEHFDIKTSRKSTLVGVPVVAPISLGTRRETDNQVKTRGETVKERGFYQRFYRAVEQELDHPR